MRLPLIALITLLVACWPAIIVAADTSDSPSRPGTAGLARSAPTVVHFDQSPPLRAMAPQPAGTGGPRWHDLLPQPQPDPQWASAPQSRDPVVQAWPGATRIPAPILSFDGHGNLGNLTPPSPVGDVGPNHYVTMSNVHFQIFNKSGSLLLGPLANNTLWAGFGGACQTENAGYPIVLYDQLADRWLLTQFTAAGPSYFLCVALSTTSNPTGTYFRWAFSTGTNFPDSPKYGVWPDAYYISTREFSTSAFVGVGAYAVNRTQMLAGNPSPLVLSFLVPPSTPSNIGDGLQPADLDGHTPPPAGRRNYFVGSMDNGGPYGAPQDALTFWRFVADFGNPPASSFTWTHTLPVAAFDSIYPCAPNFRNCIPQPGTAARLDILSYRQRLLHRLAYRNFDSHESLVGNQSVEAGPEMAGIRWFEVRLPGGTPTVFQQGTFAPGVSDGVHRWMGSVAMDGDGNIALGYSASSPSVFPSVRYAGRLASDPPGQMAQGEQVLHAGTGSQTSPGNRWGDYTALTVDPDDCTFWYVNQYLPVTSAIGWRLRIGAFRFTQCIGDRIFAHGFEL